MIRWDQDKLALPLQTGHGEFEILRDLKKAMDEKEYEWIAVREELAPDDHWEKVVAVLQEVGEAHLARGTDKKKKKECKRKG